MDARQFFELSIGRWRSQRSGHHLAFNHFEEARSTLDIIALAVDDPAVVDLCQLHGIEPAAVSQPFRVDWEGEPDSKSRKPRGSSVLLPIPDPNYPAQGKLLASPTLTTPAATVSHYSLGDDETLVLSTQYEGAVVEERIWFASPNLRFRVSLVKDNGSTDLTTALFCSEIRALGQ